MTLRPATPSPLTGPGGVTRYRDHILDELRHDPYQTKGKYSEPTRCPECGLVYAKGRWHRGDAPAGAKGTPCPACKRVADKLPAGFVRIDGPFAHEHRTEVLNLARNEAQREAEEHPLRRIIAIEEGDEEVVITTTDLHLPRRIGQALAHAWDGRLEMQQSQDEYIVRVHWRR